MDTEKAPFLKQRPRSGIGWNLDLGLLGLQSCKQQVAAHNCPASGIFPRRLPWTETRMISPLSTLCGSRLSGVLTFVPQPEDLGIMRLCRCPVCLLEMCVYSCHRLGLSGRRLGEGIEPGDVLGTDIWEGQKGWRWGGGRAQAVVQDHVHLA